MSFNNTEPGVDYRDHPDFAIAALLQMLARYPMTHCRPMACSIACHLRFVAGDPRFAEPVRQAARNAGREWSAMIEMRDHLARQQWMID
jgi:hypothetical protein